MNKEECRKRISLVREFWPLLTPDKPHAREFLDNEKREIRAYLNRPINPDRRVIVSDFESYIERVKLPDRITTEEEAETWFRRNELIPYVERGFDCTGQMFTRGHRLFHIGDSWVLYHAIQIDV